jgi:threonine aldolase
MAAKKMGKDAALLVTSGTQANLVSLMSNTKHGDAVILEAESHIFYYEVGSLSAIGGLLPMTVKGNLGVLDPKDIEAAIRPKDIHFPEQTLVCIENTHNRAGGTITTPEQIKTISEVVKAHSLRLYMDGARIFNAAVAMNVNVREFTKYVDNMMFCLSKGLSCPIGSLVVGNQEFVEKARKIRKILGGGMRQAGVIAAPGIIALEKMIARLEEDHKNAKLMAERLSKIEGISVNLKIVQTNIFNFNISDLGVTSIDFVTKLKNHGVLLLTRDRNNIRVVTHRGIEEEHIESALDAIEKVVKEIKGEKKNRI